MAAFFFGDFLAVVFLAAAFFFGDFLADFADDFEAAAGSLSAYLGRWGVGPFQTITYLDYDWTLNAQPGQRPE